MKRKIYNILLSFIILFTYPCSLAIANEQALSPSEQFIFKVINEIRENPLAVAESLGFDKKELINNSPLKDIFLKDSLPALLLNGKLNSSASNHVQDMINNNYIDYESLDGKNVKDRVLEEGYFPIVVEENLGALLFNNFITSETAVISILKYIFIDELKKNSSKELTILNPEYREIGISFCTNNFELGDSSKNGYIYNIDVAKGDNYLLELLIYCFINQIRSHPQLFLELLQDEDYRYNYKIDPKYLDKILAPLVWSDILYHASRRFIYNEEPIESYLQKHDYLSKKVIKENLNISIPANETLINKALYISTALVENQINDLEFNNSNNTIIFNSDLDEIGVSLSSQVKNKYTESFNLEIVSSKTTYSDRFLIISINPYKKFNKLFYDNNYLLTNKKYKLKLSSFITDSTQTKYSNIVDVVRFKIPIIYTPFSVYTLHVYDKSGQEIYSRRIVPMGQENILKNIFIN